MRTLAAFTVGSAATIGALHAGTMLVVNAPVAAPDAIVSLASHEWERLPVAARLACQFPKSRVILTLPPYSSRNNCHDCSNRVETLVTYGIKRNRIAIVPIKQSSTYGEALAVRDYMRGAGLRSLLIVTSTYHTRRALATFGRGSRVQRGSRGRCTCGPGNLRAPIQMVDSSLRPLVCDVRMVGDTLVSRASRRPDCDQPRRVTTTIRGRRRSAHARMITSRPSAMNQDLTE